MDQARRPVRSSFQGRIAATLIPFACLFLASCIRVGPRRISTDRFNYSSAIVTSWKEQMLTNLVKLRYMDPPVFLDVQQIVTQYTLEGSANVSTPDWEGNPAGPSAGVFGRWAESPTITYNLMSGERFIKSLLDPASPISLLQLVQSGWPVDVVFGVAVRAINGVFAISGSEKMRHKGDPRFYELLRLMRTLQMKDYFGLRFERGPGGGQVMFFRHGHPDPEAREMAKKVREILGLDPTAVEFHIAFGALNQDTKEIAFLTRSMLDILGEASAGVDVPASDLQEGRVSKPLIMDTGGEFSLQRLVQVRSSSQKPPGKEAFVSVLYRGTWFWIEDRDLNSKRGLSFLMTLLAMATPGVSIAPPVLTISKP